MPESSVVFHQEAGLISAHVGMPGQVEDVEVPRSESSHLITQAVKAPALFDKQFDLMPPGRLQDHALLSLKIEQRPDIFSRACHKEQPQWAIVHFDVMLLFSHHTRWRKQSACIRAEVSAASVKQFPW